MIIELEPLLTLSIEYEAVVVTRFSVTIMHQYCVQVIRLHTKIFVSILNQLLKFIDSAQNLLFLVLYFLI